MDTVNVLEALGDHLPTSLANSIKNKVPFDAFEMLCAKRKKEF